MAKISINQERCKGCLLCVSFCPKGNLGAGKKLNRGGIATARFKKGSACTGCALCALICPECCIEVYK
ncbi:MAG: 4Fe-4S dicluster domain-containing protein [Candidatus Omnitrophota bacterium]|nr:4Fe-4S dicluster domain-containing protein [Candidatus Omnitrophota bacterium]